MILIRTSGQGAVDLLAGVFSRPRALRAAPGNTVVHGWIAGPGGVPLDEVLVSVYRPPRSYTGEEGADISCHGGAAAAKAVLDTLRKAGFQDALPGEFSFRAFMNGKIDLTRCESVMELVSAKTRGALERAARRLSGALEREIRRIRDKLLEAVIAAEHRLDYSEDEFDSLSADSLEEEAGCLPRRDIAEDALRGLRNLSASYRRERLYQEGALAVIAGRPNAGKSSLFNALLNEDRSIVTETPGTTRDWIEASISLEGIPLRLADTAGLRDPAADPVDPGNPVGPAEALGIERSRELIGEADLILYVVDGSRGMNGEDEEFLAAGRRILLVWNKADINGAPEDSRKHFPGLAEVSAKTGKGMEELCRSLGALLAGPDQTGAFAGLGGTSSAGLGTSRQKDLIDRALAALEEALGLADRNEPLDLIAPLLRDALNALGEITGEISSADILDAMFSRFCLGK